MPGLYSLVIICMTFVPSILGQMGDDWITKIESPPQNISFNCTSKLAENIPPDGAYIERWMFPDLTNVDLNYDDGRRKVINNGMTLVVNDADIDDFGIYHCMMLYPVNNSNGDEIHQWYLIKMGLNVRGPYFEDTWEKYKTGTIIGISAGLGFLVAALIIWFVSGHKWVEPPNWNDEGQENEAFESSNPPPVLRENGTIELNECTSNPPPMLKRESVVEVDKATSKPPPKLKRESAVEVHEATSKPPPTLKRESAVEVHEATSKPPPVIVASPNSNSDVHQRKVGTADSKDDIARVEDVVTEL